MFNACLLQQLTSDTYELRITSAGFEDAVQAIDLGVGQARTLDLTLTRERSIDGCGSPRERGPDNRHELGAIGLERHIQRSGRLAGKRQNLLAASLTAPGASNTTDGAFDKIRFNGKATEQNLFRRY